MSRRLAISDGLAIVVFAAIGQLSHHGGVSIAGFGHDALPVLAGWFGAAMVFGTYREPALRPFVLTWLVGVTAGVAIRAVLLGRHLGGRELAFLVTSLVFILLFTVAGRGLLARARGAVARR
jgi:Protein of unknown function (DUF3054)